MFFLELYCFFNDPTDVGNLISGFSAFSNSSLNIWISWFMYCWSLVHEFWTLLFDSLWNEYNCVVVWALFGIAFLWDWNENWHFPVLRPLLSFPNLLAYWMQYFHSFTFRIWNSLTGIPSPPLALFVVMLPKAHLTSHSRILISSLEKYLF